MENNFNPKPNPDEPIVYQIGIEGQLNAQWTEWFNNMTITLDKDGNTLLIGSISDQSSLYGLLRKVRDLGIPLISVNRIDPSNTAPPNIN